MKNAIAKSTCLGIVAAAALASAPVRADLGADELRGSAMNSGAMVDRSISIDQGTRWVNVDYGETVHFVVTGQGEKRQFVWKFNGLADQLNLSDVDREAAMRIPIYVKQSTNPLRDAGAGSE